MKMARMPSTRPRMRGRLIEECGVGVEVGVKIGVDTITETEPDATLWVTVDSAASREEYEAGSVTGMVLTDVIVAVVAGCVIGTSTVERIVVKVDTAPSKVKASVLDVDPSRLILELSNSCLTFRSPILKTTADWW